MKALPAPLAPRVVPPSASPGDRGFGSTPDDSRPVRHFDGIVCFGGVDWWYHNRGHYDLQMMRELRECVPVLYVNSIGMRRPSPAEGRMFLRRVGRKLRSVARGAVEVAPGFTVVSPLVPPGTGSRR